MSKTRLDKILVIDFEATCWDERDSWVRSEIIEIGYCLLKRAEPRALLTLGRQGSLYVRPALLDISPFSTSIHGITLGDVISKQDLSQSWPIVKEDLGLTSLKTIPWASWGDYDRVQLERESRGKCIDPALGRTHFNIKALFDLWMGKLEISSGLADALLEIGLHFEGRQHNGEHDAVNAARVLAHIINYRK